MILKELLSAHGLRLSVASSMGLHENVWVEVKPLTKEILSSEPTSMCKTSDTSVRVLKRNFFIVEKYSDEAKRLSGRVSDALASKTLSVVMVAIDIDFNLAQQKEDCIYEVIWFDVDGIVRVERSLWLLNELIETVS